MAVAFLSAGQCNFFVSHMKHGAQYVYVSLDEAKGVDLSVNHCEFEDNGGSNE
eukprot:m.17874 g.17874  ORF g.17874 m.17874 type:complete len:53 (+) comp3542_c0_seq1:71-229(+)